MNPNQPTTDREGKRLWPWARASAQAWGGGGQISEGYRLRTGGPASYAKSSEL